MNALGKIETTYKVFGRNLTLTKSYLSIIGAHFLTASLIDNDTS